LHPNLIRTHMLDIHTFYFNPYRECTYIVVNNHDAIVIDPGMYTDREQERFVHYIREHQLQIAAILITHSHPDHICGLEMVQQLAPQAPVIGINYQMSKEIDKPMTIAGIPFRILPTPGHKEDSVCYYIEPEKTIFTGDTLFQSSIGRTDLPGGDWDTLMRSLQLLKQLPDDTIVYPGHGETTTIGEEKMQNPYL